MELTLKRLLEQAKFTTYKGKGYESAEVDAFLDRAAAMAGKVEVQLTQAMDKAKAPGGTTGPDPAAVEAEIERRVAERMAQRGGGGGEEEAAEEARRTLLMAQRTADAAIRDARSDAEKLMGDAEERANTLVAEAEARSQSIRSEGESTATKERNDARRRLAEEIHELEDVRESLRSDTETLERHVDEQRTQVGSAVAELQRLLDDPAGFRVAPVPTLRDPQVPDLSPEPEPEPAEPVAAEPVSAPEPESLPGPAGAQAAPPDADQSPDSKALDASTTPDGGAGKPADPIGWAEDAEASPQAEAPSAAHVDRLPAPALVPDLGEGFEAVDHEAPGPPVLRPADSGPPTAPVDAVDLQLGGPPEDSSADDDAFLAELRKAMADDEPLGPREGIDHGDHGDLFDDDRRGWRFGRRR